MTKPASPLIPDAPILSRKDDVFGRAKFAENLAKSIAGVPAEDGFVFALNATWGSGKTSALNMIREALGDDAKTDGKQFITVKFNPWWFSGGNFLVQDFFRQFQGALIEQGGSGENHGDAIRKLAGQIRTFSSVLTPFPVIGEWAKLVGDMSGVVERLFPNPADDIHGVREKICDSLREMSDLRVLVVMDDLDRVQPNEIREMFRLVKGVADFPNTIYLLSFDRGAVADAISGGIGGVDKAEKYLGKIIQMSLDLPPVERGLLFKYFDDQLANMFPPRSTEEWDDNYWKWGLFHDAASHFIKTPRDVKRWLNNVGAAYPVVKGEVNPVDFVAIQGLRTFTHDIYRMIWENKRLFVEMPPETQMETLALLGGGREEQQEKFNQQANKLMGDFEESAGELGEYAKKVVAAIFPRWGARFPAEKSPFEEAQMPVFPQIAFERKMARHPKMFDRYFRLSLSAGDLPRAEFLEKVALAGSNPAEFADMLLDFANRDIPGTQNTQLRTFLWQLRELLHTKEVSDNTSGIVRAFLAIGDKRSIVEKWHRFANDYGNVTYGMRDIARILLENIADENERFRICRVAYEHSEAVKTMWEWILYTFRAALNSHENGKRDAPVLKREHCETLAAIAVRKLRALAQKGDVWNWPNPFRMLYWLDEEVGSQERLDCVRKAISTPEGFADLAVEWMGLNSEETDDFNDEHLIHKAQEVAKGWAYLVTFSHEEFSDKAREILKQHPELSDKRKKALRLLIRLLENLKE